MKKLESTIQSIGVLDPAAIREAKARQDILTKPQGSLGLLEDISVQMAGIKGGPTSINRKAVIVMAGDHGVAEEGTSAYPKEVTRQMVMNFATEGAAINVLAKHEKADVVIVDIGVAADIEAPGVINRKIKYGTDNFTKGPAMSREEAVKAIEAGIDVVGGQIKKGIDLIGTGDMGIANTTASSAILIALTGAGIDQAVGKGTGVDDEGLARKKSVIAKALKINDPQKNDAVDVLAKVGGLEIAGLTGVMLGAAAHRVPVIVDGFISAAAALLASRLAPRSVNFMFASHVSVEPGHILILSEIGIQPMFHLNMRLGEGTGAVLAMNLIEASCKVINQMATFESAQVSSKESDNASVS